MSTITIKLQQADDTYVIKEVSTSGLSSGGGAAVGSAVAQPLGSVASAGTSGLASRQDHVHPYPTAAQVGAVATTAFDAKGDLLAGTSDNNMARVPAGTNGQVLTADSTQTTGLKWAAPFTIPLPISLGGTGSTTRPYPDLTTAGESLVGKNFTTNPTGPAPTSASHLTTKSYVDTLVAANVVINVMNRGVVGDSTTTNDTAAVQALIDNANGVPLYFPYRPNGYGIIGLRPKKGTVLIGDNAPVWQYAAGNSTFFRPPTGSTTGSVIEILDKELLGTSVDTDGVTIKNLGIDVHDVGTTIHGMEVRGYVRGLHLENVNVRDATGKGIYAHPYTRTDTLLYFPKGARFQRVTVESCNGTNWHMEDLTDSSWLDCHSHTAGSKGWYLTGMQDNQFTNCRAVFGQDDGFYTEASPNGRPWGSCTFTNISTDRNEKYGVRLTHTGSRPTVFAGLITRRDGRNGNAGGGNYAGLAILGPSSGSQVPPVVVTGLGQTVGVDDDGTGTDSPAYGVVVQNARMVDIKGHMWGNTDAITDLGGNTQLQIGKGTSAMFGTSTSPTYRYRVKDVSTAYSLHLYDEVVRVTTGSSQRTMTLPSPIYGLKYTIIKQDTGSGAVRIIPPSGTFMTGETQLFINWQGASMVFEATDTQWFAVPDNGGVKIINEYHPFDLRKFGAVGDGSTDNTSAVLSAVAASAATLMPGMKLQTSGGVYQGGSQANGGGEVHVPAGVFVCGNVILDRRCRIVGEGWGSVFLRKAATSGDWFTNKWDGTGHSAHVQFANLTLNGNSANQTGTGTAIHILGNTTFDYNDSLAEDFDVHCRIDNLQIILVKGDAIKLEGSGGTSVSDCRLRNINGIGINMDGFDNHANNNDIGWTDKQSIYMKGDSSGITGGKYWYSGRADAANGQGIYCEADSGSITGVRTQDNAAQGLLLANANNVTVAGANIDSASMSSSGTYAGLELSNSTYCSVMPFNVENRYNGPDTVLDALKIDTNSTNCTIIGVAGKSPWGVVNSLKSGSVKNANTYVMINGTVL